MKVTQREFDLGSLILSSEQTAKRSPGIHVSGIIRKISAAMGRKDNDFTEEQLNRFAVIGRLWERTLSDALFKPPRYERLGEFEVDGIVGSPDCFDYEEAAVLEFKVTWVSYRDFEGKQKWWEYVAQVKSYCHIVSALHARLIVLFVCGNWRDDPVPRAIEWRLTFSEQELREHWRMMRNNA